jgi:hypothetical protein
LLTAFKLEGLTYGWNNSKGKEFILIDSVLAKVLIKFSKNPTALENKKY